MVGQPCKDNTGRSDAKQRAQKDSVVDCVQTEIAALTRKTDPAGMPVLNRCHQSAGFGKGRE